MLQNAKTKPDNTQTPWAVTARKENIMEHVMEMMVEYILERCTGLETENRRLTHQVERLTEQNDQLFTETAKNADKLAKLAKISKAHITWKDGRAYALHLYDNEGLLEVIDILRIEEDDKTNF